MNQDARRVLLAVFAGAAAVFGVLAINGTWLTPGAHRDSVSYLSAAASFSERRTFEVPVTAWSDPDSVTSLSRFPPGFPLLMSVPISFGTQTHAAALWVMALSAGVSVVFLSLLASEAFGVAAAALFTGLLLLTPVFVQLHVVIWSEPTYLAITALLLYALVKRPDWPWLHGLLACAGLTVRYVGVAGTLTAVAWAAARARSARERTIGVLWAGAPSAVFLLWWRRVVAGNGEAIREAGLFGDLGRNVSQVGDMMVGWLAPGGWGGGWMVALLSLAGVLILGLAERRGAWRSPKRRHLLRALLLHGVIYVAVVIASRLLADPRIPFDSRLFMPVLVLITLVFCVSASELARGVGPKGWMSLGLFAVIWGGVALRENRLEIASVNEGGIYFTQGAWMIDPVIRWVDNQSTAFGTVYSNEPALLYYQSQRHAKELPRDGEDFGAFQRTFLDRPGAVVFAYPLHEGDIREEVFAERLGIRPVVQTSMGAVYVPSAR